MYGNDIKGKFEYTQTDVFMGFHCGNTPICHISKGALKHQLIMKRLLEPDSEPNISRGTLEGTISAGNITLFRLQGAADTTLTSYIAEGEVIDVDPRSFGSIGVFAVKEMGRFYRHVLVAKRYPHHAGVAFDHAGEVLYEAVKYLGICPCNIDYNQPSGVLYKGENPFTK
jgi:L-fucose isomerase-like protein